MAAERIENHEKAMEELKKAEEDKLNMIQTKIVEKDKKATILVKEHD